MYRFMPGWYGSLEGKRRSIYACAKSCELQILLSQEGIRHITARNRHMAQMSGTKTQPKEEVLDWLREKLKSGRKKGT